jgi:pimeloyl-ACP methyl ester carboxylesterase
MIETTRSADGTTIAFEREGDGDPLLLFGGPMTTRMSDARLVPLLSRHFSVVTVDRRGRGDSTDTKPYRVQREVDDVAAVIDAVGGWANVYGHSSGGALALHAAAAGLPIVKVAAYEPPYTTEADRPDYRDPSMSARVRAAVYTDDPETAAVEYLGGFDPHSLQQLRDTPDWPEMIDLARTIPYDLSLIGDGSIPIAEYESIAVPTMIIFGSKSWSWVPNAMAELAGIIPGARLHVMQGEDHDVSSEALASVLLEFFD